VVSIPSRQKGLAIVGLEAMAVDRRVVSTRCSRPAECVVDRDRGYLIPLDDVAAFQPAKRTLSTTGIEALNSENGETELIGEKHRLIHIFHKFHQILMI